MTEEIINSNGSRNWEANILLDNVKRLEQENKELQAYKDVNEDFKKAWDELNEKYKQLRSALEEIRKLTVIGVNASQCNCGLRALADDILNKVNEVLQ